MESLILTMAKGLVEKPDEVSDPRGEGGAGMIKMKSMRTEL